MLIDFRERGREGERERNTDVRETLIGCLLHLPQWGTKPATQACTLTWNHPATLQFITQYSNQLSHTGQGHSTS